MSTLLGHLMLKFLFLFYGFKQSMKIIICKHSLLQETTNNLHTFIWIWYSYLILINCAQLYGFKYSYLITIIFSHTISTIPNTNDLCTVIQFDVFLLNPNNLPIVIWFKVLLANTNYVQTDLFDSEMRS